MNVENFKRVLDHIKAHPETWDQKGWHCGTAHCFAGHAEIMSGNYFERSPTRINAKTFLDISWIEAYYLFNSDRIIADFDDILAKGFPALT